MPSLRLSVISLAAALLVPAAATYAQGDPHVVRAAFRSGGIVHLDLNSGEIDVVPGDGDSVVVRWMGKNADQAHAAIQVRGEQATVRTSGERDDVHYVIVIPRESDVVARCTAGDVTIGAFDGDVDAALRFGDLHVETLDPAQYADVDASVGVGDMGQHVFQASEHGTLGKSIHVTGHGPNRLHARVSFGDLSLTRATGDAAQARND
jgi:hypothetical protein